MASLELGQAIQGEALMDSYSGVTLGRGSNASAGERHRTVSRALYFIVLLRRMQFCLQDVNGHFTLQTFTQIAQAPGFYSLSGSRRSWRSRRWRSY